MLCHPFDDSNCSRVFHHECYPHTMKTTFLLQCPPRIMSTPTVDVRPMWWCPPQTDDVRVGGPNVTAAWSLHLTKLYAALNSVLGTADRYRTLLASQVKRTVSWLSRIQWSQIALLPCLLTRPNLHKLRVTNLVALSLWRKVEKRWRNELRICVVLRPDFNTAFQSICAYLTMVYISFTIIL